MQSPTELAAASAQAPTRPIAELGAPGLVLYDRACAALAAAKSVDEVKDIVDASAAMRAHARPAKNRDLEADAVELRMRATRRLDQMRQAQAATVGLNQGAVPGKTGLEANPVLDLRPTLASQGIDKVLAHQGRLLGRMSDQAFERKVVEARSSVARVFRRAVREVEIAQEREERRAQTAQGGSVADLYALIASGYRHRDRQPMAIRNVQRARQGRRVRALRDADARRDQGAARSRSSRRRTALSSCGQPGPTCRCGRRS
jgi:hypothetical protein